MCGLKKNKKQERVSQRNFIHLSFEFGAFSDGIIYIMAMIIMIIANFPIKIYIQTFRPIKIIIVILNTPIYAIFFHIPATNRDEKM